MFSFASLATVISVGLIWTGIRIYKQDRELAIHQIESLIQSSADLISADFLVAASVFENRLEEFSRDQFTGNSQSDHIVFSATGSEFRATPEANLLFPPILPADNSQSDSENLIISALSFSDSEPDEIEAANMYLASESEPALKMEALLALYRLHGKAGRTDLQLQALDQLDDYDGNYIQGIPADLWALYGRCRIKEEQQDLPGLINEANRLANDLQLGRWLITYPVYRVFLENCLEWINSDSGSSGSQSIPLTVSDNLSAAVYSLWYAWKTGNSNRANVAQVNWFTQLLTAGQTFALREIDGENWFFQWKVSEQQIKAAVGKGETFLNWWAPSILEYLEQNELGLAISDEAGRYITGDEPPQDPYTLLLSSSQTGFPWDFYLWPLNPDALTASGNRRSRFFLASLLLVGMLVMLSGFAMTRTTMREIRVAKLQSDILSAVSHEFRSPLTSVRQLSELIAHDRVMSEEQKNLYFEAISRGSIRLQRLIEDLLDFRRMEAGIWEYKMRPLDIAAMVAEVIEIFSDEVAHQGYKIELESTIADVAVHGNRETLGRALRNLLDNAVKYSPNNKTIRTRVDRTDHSIRITVSDQGIGIPKSEHDSIFDTFVRGESAQQTLAKGTGLGLSIVWQIVHAHKGSIEVESQPGTGSSFTILLPEKD